MTTSAECRACSPTHSCLAHTCIDCGRRTDVVHSPCPPGRYARISAPSGRRSVYVTVYAPDGRHLYGTRRATRAEAEVVAASWDAEVVR